MQLHKSMMLTIVAIVLTVEADSTVTGTSDCGVDGEIAQPPRKAAATHRAGAAKRRAMPVKNTECIMSLTCSLRR